MKKNWLLLAFIAIFITPLSAQNFEYHSGKISTLEFLGGLPVLRDDGSGAYDSLDYYYDDSTETFVSQPVAYVSGDIMKANVRMAFDCQSAPDSLYIRGFGPDSITFEPFAAYRSGIPGSFIFSRDSVSVDDPFTPGVVGYYKPFTIQWEFSLDGVYWFDADTTSNTVWVVKDNPMVQTSNFQYWETVYDVSCRNAVGKSTEEDIIDAVWSEYTDFVVLNYHGDSLFYYKEMNTMNVTLGALLKYRDAQCFTFTQLFLATIKIHGIAKTGNYVNVTPYTVPACMGANINRFLVKNWSFGSPSFAGECPELPYKNTYTSLIPAPYNAYVFNTQDVYDETGIPGACNPNPSSYFNNHQIAFVNGMYYDPNTGVAYPTLEEYTTESIDAWSASYNQAGETHCIFTTNLSKTSFSASYATY